MQELTHKTRLKIEELTDRSVTIFLQSKFFVLKACWHWDMFADAVFCSDVILPLSDPFTGVKGIIHPDDVVGVEEKLQDRKITCLKFRIITTYGEVKTIRGEDVIAEDGEEQFDAGGLLQAARQELEWKKEFEHLQLLKETYERTGRLNNTGVWWYNSVTNKTWHSPQVFRIHDLAPYSLNAHLNTFTHLIHPEDRDKVTEFVHRAYKQRSPLHIEYRVKTARGERNILYATQWFFNTRGEAILSGMMQDVTEEKALEQELEERADLVRFCQQQLAFDEQNASIGHWQVNLITRRTAFSDHYYRIFGLRPQSVPADIQSIINYIHPDDRDRYTVAHKKMVYEHLVPEIDFRILRNDGELRYVSQKAKLIPYGAELLMTGILLDVTVQKMLEKKIKTLSEADTIKSFAHAQAAEMAGIAGWVWDLSTGKIAWSENFYQLLGYKASAAELTQTQFLQYIHPDDQKQFKDQLARALEQKMETKFSFRLLRRGNIKHLKASFRILNNGGTDLFICSLQDVTNEHDLQQQLNQQMQLAEALSGNILDRVIITDLNNTIFFWNAACEDVYRLKKPEVLGKNFFDVFQKLKTEQEVVLFNRVLNGERIILKDQKSSLGQGYFDLHMLPLWGDGKKEEVSGIIHIIRDVTKEVELKQNLNDRLRFIENLVDSSVDRIIAMDRNLNYLVWNKKCVEYYGLQKEEVIGKNVLELFPDTQNTPAFSEFKKVLKGETVYIPPVRESGKEAYHEIYLIPVKNEKDETSAILWILHDLSKEYDLMKEQRRSGEIINALNENYFEIDREYRVLYINPKGEEHFGKSKEELLKKNIWELFPQAVNTPVYHAVKKAMEEREAVRGEFISPTKGTSIFSSMMPTEEGVAVIFFDIHELKAAEEKLQQSKDLLNAVFNASLHGISLFKTIRNKENRIVDFEFALVNDVIRKWYGRDLAGKRYLKESPAIKENGVLEGFAKVIETGAPMVTEVQEGKSWYRMTAVKLGDDLVCTAEDITTRKKEEEELQMTISILSQSEEMAQIGSWDYDIATGAFKWSEGMYRLFGLPQCAIVEPEIYLRFSNPKDRAIAEKIVSCLRNGNCSFEEMMHIQRDGTERLLKIKGTVIHDKKGKPQKVIGIDLDITDAHIAEQKIEESANLLQKMAQASPDSITIYDLVQKAPVYLNHCLANWVDCSLDELLSMGYEGRLSLIHPEDRKKVEAFNQEMLSASDGEIKTVDYRLQSGKGKIIDIRNRSKVFKRNTKGEVTHILSVLTDVTEEVQLKKKLIERTHYVEAIIDNSIDRIMVYDQSYTVIGWNRRSEEHTGVKKERAIGANFFELVPQALHDEEIKGVMQKALEGNYQYIPVKKGIYTHYFYERFYIPLKDAEGNTYAVLNLMHDLSETVKKNEELKELNRTLEQQNKDLEARNEEVTNFAFIASHDLREPLRKISTFSNWLMTEEEKVLSPKGKDYLQRMALAVNRMNAMIDDILVLTRINAESKKEEEVDLNEVLFFVQQDLKKEIAKTKADLIIEKLPSVWGNRNHLVQLFKNLVSNAIKFRVPDRAPEIRITSKFVSGKDAPSANANREKNYVNICIKDNGIGIDLKYAGKLFQVFQRLHGLKEYKGTGMGLAICKKVMEKHNGFITVDGTPGAGSEFCCYFPL